MSEPSSLLPWIDPPAGGYRRLQASLDADHTASVGASPSMVLAPVVSFFATLILAMSWIPATRGPMIPDLHTFPAVDIRSSNDDRTDHDPRLALLTESESGIRLYVAIVHADDAWENRSQ